MSISEQVKELRKLANSKEFEPHEPVTYGFYARIKSKLFKAADTIESLSAKLQAKEYCDGCPGADIIEIPCTEECKRRHFKAENMQRSAEDCGGGWIKISDRVPTMEECQKNDNRFILDDGNRRYGGLFDYQKRCFVQFDFWKGLVEDKCAIAWRPLPNPYNEP